MTRAIGYCILLVFGGVSLVLAASRPEWVGDQNAFLKNFVNHEFLNVLGVTLAITLASAANIHLQFNKIEETFNIPGGLAGSRADLRQAASVLIILFIVAVVVVVAKPIAASGPVGEAFFNMVALLILLWHVLLLLSLVELVFAIPPHFPDADFQTAIPPPVEPSGSQPPPSIGEKTQP